MDQLVFTQFLKTMFDRMNSELDDNSYDNTVIQFFEAPFETVSLGAFVLSSSYTDPSSSIVWASSSVTSSFTWDNGGQWDPMSPALSTQDSEQLTFSASSVVSTAFPADLAWGSSAVDANWSWSLGGQWLAQQEILTLWPVIYDNGGTG